ncbi:Methyltransferase domain-containing protein [Desulfacinum hydrothermale DSM 13146]|uniref:Methyltransferase domain-containing protein n=1 Tax=Desulfacinum hydrothermale DSM 13146 TaxID=1121390 RepID=A0A1W1XF93_9BACT|nr:class I SAM-dependent methyltransferase [Desulfacinum hydrothermale]SMC22606.1 Methyltransferase domain-containing protein [Desulfacinum hydrothermale DSM 13146]
MREEIRRRLLGLKERFERSPWKFRWLYRRGKTPWDTQITPPEVMEFIQRTPPGRALDLGCGTGTNAITLARHGWDVTGVDFAPEAIEAARRKAARAGVGVTFHVSDVTDLSMLKGPFDYVLDIGCLFILNDEKRRQYARNLDRLTAPGGCYMLYAWMPRPWRGGVWGISPQEVEALIGDRFQKERVVVGQEKGHPSAWYWYSKRP